MKVKELIERLQECDKELNVYGCYTDDNLLRDSDFIVDVMQVSKSKAESNNGVYLRIKSWHTYITQTQPF